VLADRADLFAHEVEQVRAIGPPAPRPGLVNHNQPGSRRERVAQRGDLPRVALLTVTPLGSGAIGTHTTNSIKVTVRFIRFHAASIMTARIWIAGHF
jgi:hypothetical protein